MEAKSITIGQYIAGETILHILDPRTKMISLFMFIAAVFLVQDYRVFIVFLAVIVVLYSLARLPAIYLYRGLKPVFYIAVLTFLLHAFFTPGGEVLFRFGNITVEYAGIMMGIFTVFRLILLVFAAMLITLTTTPLTLTAGLEYFLLPLRYVGLPVADIAMILTISLRFIPTLMEESQRIARAQMARGADYGEGNIIRKIRFLVPLIVPLFVSAFRRADELAVAMEARGYRVGERRTRMNELKLMKRDYMAVFIAALPVFLMVWLGLGQ